MARRPRRLTRADLAGPPAAVLKDEGAGAARVLRYDLPGGAVVAKLWQVEERSGLLRRMWRGVAQRLMRREIRHYRLLEGVPGVPAYLGHDGDELLIVEWVAGRPIRRDLPPEVLRDGLDSLERTLAGLHERRFAHLDVHQKLNCLIDARGQAWLVDLAAGLDCSRWPLRLIFPLLARIDRNAVLKFRARYAPDTLPEADRERVVARHGVRRLRWPKWLSRQVRRLIERHD